jgi:hypothetical protein
VPAQAQVAGRLEDSVREQAEVVTVPGPECYPTAIVTIDHVNDSFETLLASADFEEEYPDGLTSEIVFAESQKTEIDRLKKMRAAYAEAIEKYRGQGLPEGEAILRANKDMEERGYYPATPTMMAKPVEAVRSDQPLFEISDKELEAGIFPDIDAAIGSPGLRVDKDMGHYVTHSDYETSRKINEYLDTGATTFQVRARGRVWEIAIDRNP